MPPKSKQPDLVEVRTDRYDSYQNSPSPDIDSTEPPHQQPFTYNSSIYNSPTAGLRQPLLSQVINLNRNSNNILNESSDDDVHLSTPSTTDTTIATTTTTQSQYQQQYTFVRRRPEDEWPIKYKLSDHAKSLLTDTAIKPARKPSSNDTPIDDLDWLMLGISIVLLIIYIVLYDFTPEADVEIITSNPLHQWIGAVLSIIVIYYISSLIELLVMHSLWLLNNTSMWKLYYYGQCLDSCIKWLLTLSYIYWLRHGSTLLQFQSEQTLKYLDPILIFIILCLFAGMLRRFWVKLVTYRFNNGTYSQLIDEMYFKHNVLQRLANKTAYYQIVRPVSNPVASSTGLSRSTSFASLAVQANATHDTEKIKPKQGSGFSQFFSRLGKLSHDNQDSLATPIGSIHFSKKIKANKLSRDVFTNVDRVKKGYIIASDLQNYLPEKTAIAAFDMLLSTLKELKVGHGTSTQLDDEQDDAGVAESTKAPPPTPFMMDKKKKVKTSGVKNDSNTNTDNNINGSTAESVLSAPPPSLSTSTSTDDSHVSFAPDTIGGLSPASKPSQSQVQLQFPSVANVPSSRVPRSISQPIGNTDTTLPSINDLIHNKKSMKLKNALIQKDTVTNNSIDSIATFRLTEKQLNLIVMKYYKDYKKLVDTIKNTNGLSSVIDSLSQLVYWMGVMFALTIAFNQYIRQFAITISTVFFSMTFIFSQSLRDMFTAIIFLFYLKPYSVGDRVDIGTAKYRVVSIQLLTTTFRTLDQRITTVPNNQLASATISNLSRSKNAIVRYSFSVGIDTSCHTLALLRDSVVQHINQNTEHWSPNISMHFASVSPNENSLTISLWLKSKYLYTEVKALKRCKTEVLHVVREAMIQHNVTWTYPGVDINMLDQPLGSGDTVQAGNATIGPVGSGGGNAAQNAAMLGSSTGVGGKMGKMGKFGRRSNTAATQQQQQQQQQQMQQSNPDDDLLGIS